MIVEPNKDYLYSYIKDLVNKAREEEKLDFSEINNSINSMIEGIEYCKYLIKNRDNLSNEEFYKILEKFAYISDFDDFDCFKVVEMASHTKFKGYTVLETDMTYVLTPKHGKGFEWWEDKMGVDLRVLYTEDFEMQNDHLYTKAEIQKLLDEKKILILNEDDRYLDYDDEEEEIPEEDYHEFGEAYNDTNLDFEFFDKKGKFYPYTLEYIKKELTNKELNKLLEEQLDHINNELKRIIELKGSQNGNLINVSREYQEEFEKQGFARRLKMINENK